MTLKFVNILSLLLAAALVLGGCGTENPKNALTAEEKTTVEFSGEENPPESALPETQAPPVTEEKPDFGDLFRSIKSHGKTVEAYGLLAEESYAAALQELEQALSETGYGVSITIVSLDSQKALSYNTEKTLFCACTVKAAYVLYCLEEMEKRDISLTLPLTYESHHYESGTGDMQYSPVGTVFPLETVFNKTLTVSDNVGYRMLVDYFGREGYNAWITEKGCPSLQISPTVWSLKAKSAELAILWQEIAKYFENGGKYADFLRSICTDTGAAYATQSLEGVHTSHKSGHNGTGKWLAYSDAGILWDENSPYVYSILTDAPGLHSSAGAQIMAKAMNIIHNKLMK